MPDLYRWVRPILWNLPPETAHNVALWTLRMGLGGFAADREARRPDPPVLHQKLWGLDFPNPIGAAAGFDKNGMIPDQLLQLGFGSVEIGTVTPRPQRGNRKPRLFRLDQDEAVINSMGFPSDGLDAVLARLSKRGTRKGVIGINVGKNRETEIAADDYTVGIRRAAELGDYLVVNVSSPNTPGLRDLQRRVPLHALIETLISARDATGFRRPLLLKIAPDLTPDERVDVAEVSIATGIDGIIIANTTVARPSELGSDLAKEPGGLSGRPLFRVSTDLLFDLYQLTGGRIPLVGVGGITSAEDAYAKIRAGASLVQLHTALIFGGMSLVTHIKRRLVDLLKADSYSNVADAVGADHQPLQRLQTSRISRPPALNDRGRIMAVDTGRLIAEV